ncbi:MAG: hypothetical protein JEY79_14150 [Pseudodesulfovibrio sp.]|nr:hypothetical protein [Pseudodesulfovibrio sp.]
MNYIQIKTAPTYEQLMDMEKAALVRLVGRLTAEYIEIRDTARALVESVDPKKPGVTYESWPEMERLEKLLGIDERNVNENERTVGK